MSNVDRELKIVDAKLSSYKNNLSHLLTPHLNAIVKHTIHDLNRQIYTQNKQTKDTKLSDLSTSKPHPTDQTNPQTDSVTGNTSVDPPSCPLVCIPDSIELSIHERSLLSRGLNFVTLTPNTDPIQLSVGLERFFDHCVGKIN